MFQFNNIYNLNILKVYPTVTYLQRRIYVRMCFQTHTLI